QQPCRGLRTVDASTALAPTWTLAREGEPCSWWGVELDRRIGREDRLPSSRPIALRRSLCRRRGVVHCCARAEAPGTRTATAPATRACRIRIRRLACSPSTAVF